MTLNGRFTVYQYRLFQIDMHCDESRDVIVTLRRPIPLVRPSEFFSQVRFVIGGRRQLVIGQIFIAFTGYDVTRK